MSSGLKSSFASDGRGPSLDRVIRVAVAEDHESTRRGLCLLLGAEPDIEIVAEVADLDQALLAVELERPEVIVCALHPQGGSRIAAVRLLLGVAEAAIVFATMVVDAALAQAAFDAGAHAYICKDRAEVELTPAVRAAARGERFVNPRVAERLQPGC